MVGLISLLVPPQLCVHAGGRVTLLLPCFLFLARLQCCCILHVHLLFYMRLAGFSAGGSVAIAEQAAAAADWLSVCVRTASDPSCVTTTTSCFACMCSLSYFMCAGVCHAYQWHAFCTTAESDCKPRSYSALAVSAPQRVAAAFHQRTGSLVGEADAACVISCTTAH
jgi:hypothetical protein